MASNAAPPGLGNCVENAPTPFPHPTSARTPADLSADIAVTDKKIASAEEKMEGAGAKLESAGSTSAITNKKSADASSKYAGPGTEQEDKRAARATPSCNQPSDITRVNKEAVALADHGL